MPRQKQEPIDDKTFRPSNWKAGSGSGTKTVHRKPSKRKRLSSSSAARQQSSTANPSAHPSSLLPSNHITAPPPPLETATTTIALPICAPPNLVLPKLSADDWSSEELTLLKNFADMGLGWETVAMEIVGRSAEDCRGRYMGMHMRVWGERWDMGVEEVEDVDVDVDVDEGGDGRGDDRRNGGGVNGDGKGGREGKVGGGGEGDWKGKGKGKWDRNQGGDDGVKKSKVRVKDKHSPPALPFPPPENPLLLLTVPTVPSQPLLPTPLTTTTTTTPQTRTNPAPFRFISYPPQATTFIAIPLPPPSSSSSPSIPNPSSSPLTPSSSFPTPTTNYYSVPVNHQHLQIPAFAQRFMPLQTRIYPWMARPVGEGTGGVVGREGMGRRGSRGGRRRRFGRGNGRERWFGDEGDEEGEVGVMGGGEWDRGKE